MVLLLALSYVYGVIPLQPIYLRYHLAYALTHLHSARFQTLCLSTPTLWPSALQPYDS